MVVPFGVSVGDFIAGIKLVYDLADGLKESCGSVSDFRKLVRQLHSLEKALISVKNVIDPKNPESLPYDTAHVDALKQIVLQAKRTVDEFLDTNRKFLLSLGVVGGNRIRCKGLDEKGPMEEIQEGGCSSVEVEN